MAYRTEGGRETRPSDTRATTLVEGLGTSRYQEYELAPYAQVVRVRIPHVLWDAVLFSWLSLKGHLQGLWQFDRTQFFATVLEDGSVDATMVVVWQGAEAIDQWLEHGYSADTMLREMGIPESNIDVCLMRDFS
jgi:hypothetical protein